MGAPGLGAAPLGAGAFGVGAFGVGALGAGTGAEASGADAWGTTGFFGAGLAAPGFGALGAGLVSAFLLLCAAANFSRICRTTGGSSEDEDDLTNSPASFRCPISSLLVIPSSLASSWTRNFATFLHSGSVSGPETPY